VNRVGRDVPFTLITVEGTNPVPVTTTSADAVPAGSLAGEIDVIVGAGLSTSRWTVVPELPVVPFTTVTASSAPLLIWLAGTVAVSWVALTYVVASAVPPTCTTLLETNPVPLIVRVSAFEPAVTLVGLIDMMAGVPLLPEPPVPPPPPEPLEPEPPPPQPPIRRATPNPKLAKPKERYTELRHEPTFTTGPASQSTLLCAD